MPRRKKVEEEQPSSSRKGKKEEDEPVQKKKRGKEERPTTSRKAKEDEPPQKKKRGKEEQSSSKKVKEAELSQRKTRGKADATKKSEEPPEGDENVNPNIVKIDDWANKESKIKPIKSFVQFCEIFRLGKKNSTQLRHYLVDPVMTNVKSFQWLKGECCFDNRVTFLEWHPNNPCVLAAASKNGDIILWDHNKNIETSKMIKGDGPGYSIQAMKFHRLEPDSIYTVSISGKFLKDNFQTNVKSVILDAGEWMKRWFTACDINFGGKVMVVGDNDGYVTLLTTEGKITREFKAAKAGAKINHCEFSKSAPWLLVTSTGDKCVKLWDIRKIDKKAEPLEVLQQSKPINSACFSLTDGARLLTTDQYDQITVYRGPVWYEETVIKHPHRHFQHLTPIKANWHPLEDIVVCGRYPDKRNIITESDGVSDTGLRTIDFFDATNGKLLLQHHTPTFNHIVSLSKFNSLGDTLACGAGRYVVIWKPNFKQQDDTDKKFFKRSSKRGDDDDDDDDDEDKKKPPKDNKINKTKLFQRKSTKKEAKKINVTWKKEK